MATAVIGAALAFSAAGASAASTPRWMKHIQRYPGGISAGVRAMVSDEAVAARAKYGQAHLFASRVVHGDRTCR